MGAPLVAARWSLGVAAVALLLAACTPVENPAATPPAPGVPDPVSIATPSAATPADLTSNESTAPCIESGGHTAIQDALTGVGAEAVLCPGAVFELSETIFLTADGQKIYTQGLPTDDSRALLQVVGPEVSTAVVAGNNADVELRNVIIDGNFPRLGQGYDGALIEWGGAAPGHVVEWVKAYEPRGWSVLYLGEGDDHKCSGAVARYNELGPAGDPLFGIADGISLACRDSVVEYNTIVDVTDGGIVIFQAPGSLVANNTIIADSRIMFYGISMEDYGPFDGDFRGTRVIGNVIDARGALIRRGLAMGPGIGCIFEEGEVRSRGAVVTGNTLKGTHMGYGFVVAGVQDWVVTDNVDLSTHLVPDREVDCFGNVVDHPAGFQMNASTSSGTFQDEFEASTLGFTTDWWPNQPVYSEPCLEELIGSEALEEIKTGRAGPVLEAIEAADRGRFAARCITLYAEPDLGDVPGFIQVGVFPCESYCIEVELINITDGEVDLRQAEFLLEGFLVECSGLPERIPAWETIRCTIEDYVTDGFQVLWWYGFPPGGGHWGFDYPFPADA